MPCGLRGSGRSPPPGRDSTSRQFLPRDRQETQSVKRPKPAPLKRQERPGAGTAPCLCCPPCSWCQGSCGVQKPPSQTPRGQTGLTRISSAFQLLEGVFQVPRHHQRGRWKLMSTASSPEQEQGIQTVSMVSQNHKVLQYLQCHSNKLQPSQMKILSF